MAILAGQLLTASALNALAGSIVILDADVSRASDTTFFSTGLTLSVEANSKYLFRLLLCVDANTAADWKYNLLLPAAATLTHSSWASGTGVGAGVLDGTIFHDRFTVASSPAGGLNAGTVVTAIPTGVIRTAATAGSVTVQFAQNTSNATASILKADSMMQLIKG